MSSKGKIDMELRIDHLSKRFKDKIAVNDVSITLSEGIWGLIGANGAGKTTLMRMIVDILKPTNGTIYFNGVNIKKMGKNYRDLLGFLPQDFGYSSDFTVKDYLEYIAALKDIPVNETQNKINQLLDRLSLSDVNGNKISTLSGGMKRRVGIAQAMLNSPRILLLDEPTSGLDPGERIRFRNFISEFSHECIVLISTHIVSDIENFASQNAIMKEGQIINIGTTESLLKQIEGKVWSCRVPTKSIPKYLGKLKITYLKEEDGGQWFVRYLSEQPMISGSIPATPRLEELYLYLFPYENIKREAL